MSENFQKTGFEIFRKATAKFFIQKKIQNRGVNISNISRTHVGTYTSIIFALRRSASVGPASRAFCTLKIVKEEKRRNVKTDRRKGESESLKWRKNRKLGGLKKREKRKEINIKKN